MLTATKRRTLASAATVIGRGLFTGEPAELTIHPAEPADTPRGILFRPFDRTDVLIPAHASALSARPAHPAFDRMPPRNTALEAAGAAIHTVEHLLAALAAAGVTDAEIEFHGPEVPIDDGSADIFTAEIHNAGLRTLPGPTPEPIVVREPFEVVSDDARARVRFEPLPRAVQPTFTYRLDYGQDAPIPRSEARWDGTPEDFAAHIAPARTFCLAREAGQMQALGLFAHLDASHMLVIEDEGERRGAPLAGNALRFPDEPARHKLLDLIGDLALIARPLRARVIAERSGHALHHKAARALLALPPSSSLSSPA